VAVILLPQLLQAARRTRAVPDHRCLRARRERRPFRVAVPEAL